MQHPRLPVLAALALLSLAVAQECLHQAAAGSCTALQSYDVVVVGGGISGLTAARDLLRAGHTVAVLEAKASLGGRCQRAAMTRADGTELACDQPQCTAGAVGGKWWFDLGGQWVGPSQRRFLSMAAEYGVQLYNASQWQGHTRLFINGTAVLMPPGILAGEALTPELLARHSFSEQQVQSLQEYSRLVKRLDAVIASVDVAEPWKTPGAAELDSVTFSSWLEQQSSDKFARDLVSSLHLVQGGIGGVLGGWVSALHVARQLKASPMSEGPEDWLFYGGAGQFADHLAKEIEGLGGKIVLSSPARHISQGPGGVIVRSDGGVFSGKFAVVAMAPHLTGRLSYNPPLPRKRTQLVQRAPMASIFKVVSVYDSPFWRNGSAIGEAFTSVIDPDPALPIREGWDVSPPDGPGVIASFMYPDHAFGLLEAGGEAVKAAVLRKFADFFEHRGIANPLNFVCIDWLSDQWVGGAFTSTLTPGAWTTFGEALFAPVGRIHWAGTDVAHKWPGYYEGAVIAGEEAAQTLSGLLKA